MSLPKGWEIRRENEYTIIVKDPCVSTEIVLEILSPDRRVRSYYNLCDDLLAEQSEAVELPPG